MKKKKNTISFRIPILVILFLIAFSILPISTKFALFVKPQASDRLVGKAGYPEIKGKKPTFQVDIRTDDSTTHVISYLPESLLPRAKFHEEAVKKAVSYVERLVRKDQTYTFNPYYEGGSKHSVKLALKQPNAKNFVYFISPKDELPNELEQLRYQYSLLDSSIAGGKTFFWTIFKDGGSMTIIRFSEGDTWKYGLPQVNGKGIDATEQLNVGFNIEVWKRTISIVPIDDAKYLPTYDRIVFDTSESLWNTFGQLMVAKQEGVPVVLMQQRLDNRLLNKTRNRAYYPFDEKAKALYDNAPTEPIIK